LAGTSLLSLLDDIASLLDDVAVMTKMATTKSAGVMGDDLALSTNQVAGVKADRELPVVWAVTKGSFLNKLILVPTAVAISALVPWAITPLLMLGGLFLCFEGFEKVAHKLFSPKAAKHEQHAKLVEALADPAVDVVAFEKDKIKGAIRTDLILSAEIIVITLGIVAAKPIFTRLAVLSATAVLMTIVVYGIVAAIVKLDDAGLALSKRPGASGLGRGQRALGRGILATAPNLMKGLSVVGTAAMFLVGGGILLHGIPAAEAFLDEETAKWGGLLETLATTLAEAVVGIVAGAVAVGARSLFPKKAAA
jgi:predicted DNA repair protein MutK